VSETDQLIAGALRKFAAQADPVTPAADTLWRAGQRRRRRGVMAAAAAAGGAVVATVLALTLTMGGGSRTVGTSAQGGTGGAPGAAASVALSTPILFEQVARTSPPPCAAGVNSMPGIGRARRVCLRFTGTGMTVHRVRSARVQRSASGQYQLDFSLAPADARRYAALTRELAAQPSPRCQLAIILNGHVLAHPQVLAAVTTGQAVIPGFPTRPQAEFFLATLLNR